MQHIQHTAEIYSMLGIPWGKKKPTLLLILISGFEHVSAGSAGNFKWKFYSCTAFTCI